MTHGDTFHQGKRNYDSVLPCPNGLEVRDTKPREHEAWRRRVERARSDIAISEQAVRIAQKAESITKECFDLWCTIMTGEIECPT